jgi:hypothetical protein
MSPPSKSATYLGDRLPQLPDFDSHTASSDDYVFEPNWHVLTMLVDPSKQPKVTIKKVRKLQREKTAEEDY